VNPARIGVDTSIQAGGGSKALTLKTAVNAKTPRGKDAKDREMAREGQR
jgi:hypothetical protein